MTRLKLLLTYLQNGIKDPWQKIPTILAVFVAEASVILLDPCHEHYPVISKFLLHSSRINLKVSTTKLKSTLSFPFYCANVVNIRLLSSRLLAHYSNFFAVHTFVS